MMNNSLLSLVSLVLPESILSRFEIVNIESDSLSIKIYLDEIAKSEYLSCPSIESKGFLSAVSVRDFPIRDKSVDLIVRRRRWLDKRTGACFTAPYDDLLAKGTRYSKELAAFLKEVYGEQSYDLPFA